MPWRKSINDEIKSLTLEPNELTILMKYETGFAILIDFASVRSSNFKGRCRKNKQNILEIT